MSELLHTDDDGREWYAVPRSWIDHGVDEQGEGVRLYAVSVAHKSFLSRHMCRIRYGHPETQEYQAVVWEVTDHDGGYVPSKLAADGARWHRSWLDPGAGPQGRLSVAEQHWFEELWADRLRERGEASPQEGSA